MNEQESTPYTEYNVKAYEEYRKEVLSNPREYPNLFRVETLRNKIKFMGD